MMAARERNSGRLPPGGRFYLGADVGGTHANFGILQAVPKKGGKNQEKPHFRIVYAFKFPTGEIHDFSSLARQFVQHARVKMGITLSSGCFAGAGPVSPDRKSIRLTNAPRAVLNSADLRKIIPCVLLNDFEAMGYGLQVVPRQKIIPLLRGKPARNAVPGTKALLGAGTGLGKVILPWNRHVRRYVPLASEGGHANAALSREECSLLEPSKRKSGSGEARSNQLRPLEEWDALVSGPGLSRIYRQLENRQNVTPYPNRIKEKIRASGYAPELIMHYHHQDSQCRKAVEIFLRLYARCAKNLALDALALGGIYLGGGIAAGNPGLFRHKVFKQEFLSGHPVLTEIPVSVITDYDVSLYGAGYAAWLHQRGEFP